MENQLKNQLGKLLTLTNLEDEPEEYVLTPEEEDARIYHEIESKKMQAVFKLRALEYSEGDILKKIAETDWESQICRQTALKQANSAKLQNMWHEAQRKKEAANEAKNRLELITRCDASYMFKLMKWTSLNVFGKNLVVNQYNKLFITALCYFLSRDERFEKELGFSFSKGLLVRGVSGLGKTHLVRCLEQNELNPVLVLSMIEITDDVKQDGEYEIKMGRNKVVYLDDVGTEEPVVNHYGTKITFFKNFIEMVYLKSKGYNNLIISTNNSFSEIEEKYGFRVRSRIKDMFNIIDLKGEDMRG